jgi:hypothetical protein
MVGASRQVRSNFRKELMTAHTVAGLLIERPTPRGVSRIYGYLDDGIDGITATPLRNEGHNDLGAHSAAVVQAIEVGIQALHLGSPSD